MAIGPGVPAAAAAEAPGDAAPVVPLRGGTHPGFGRLVFDLPAGAAPSVHAGPVGIQVRLPGATFRPPAALPPGLRGLTLTRGEAVLTLEPGSLVRQMRLTGRLVIDVLPGPGGPPAATPAPASISASAPNLPHTAPRSAPPPAAVRSPGPAAPAAPPIAAPPIAAAATASPPPPPATPASTPPAAAARPAPEPAPTTTAGPMPVSLTAQVVPGPAVVLPFAPGTAAAAFARGDSAVLVFDEARPVQLPEAGFRGATVQLLSDATVLRLHLPPGAGLTLSTVDAGWRVAIAGDAGAPRPVRPIADGNRLLLPLERPGHVVAIPDPLTGTVLLAGTQRGGEPGTAAGVPVARSDPRFRLPATWQGVVLEALADDVLLRPDPQGFAVEAGPAVALALAAPMAAPMGAPAAAPDAGLLSRRLDLPSQPVAALMQRQQTAALDTALAPARSRGPARLKAAEAQLALGLGAEAQATATLAATDDPRLLADPRAIMIRAAGALLAGRPEEAAGLDDPALSAPGAPGRDEAALWQALRRATLADRTEQPAPAAAQRLAAGWTLLDAYPQPLRDRLLPLAARTLALGGEPDAARALLATDRGPGGGGGRLSAGLDYARALLDAAGGHTPQALARLDALAHAPDRDMRARAAIRAVALRLQTGALSAAQAADALDRLIAAWRGDRRELSVRLREAELRRAAGQAPAALALLREAADPALSQAWPDQRDAIAAALRTTFAQALAQDQAAPLPPLAFVDLVQDNADLLPDGAAGQALAERVADRLGALDLPDRAATILERLLPAAPAGAPRAALGARLAALKLEQDDGPGALHALSASTAEGLPADLTEQRTLIYARATAEGGDLPAAEGALQALGTPAADDLRATLLEQARKWPEATAALRRLADRTLPTDGPLSQAQTALLLRLASAAAQAGDGAVLEDLRGRMLQRLAAGPQADLLRVLTAGPVQTVADLPRAGAEMALARSVLK